MCKRPIFVAFDDNGLDYTYLSSGVNKHQEEPKSTGGISYFRFLPAGKYDMMSHLKLVAPMKQGRGCN